MNALSLYAVFADAKLNKAFHEFGYVVTPLLSAVAVEELKNFYANNPNPFGGSFHTTHFATDKAYKKKVHDAIVAAVAPFAQTLLPNYVPVFGNYMVKEAGGNNPMPLHADWTYVDESQYLSLAIWVPLVDTTISNGAFGVIPFSQHLSYHIRGPRIVQWQPPCNELLIQKMGKLLTVKAGEAVVYNHRMLHYSAPNNSAGVRPAINLSMVPSNVPVLHYSIPERKDNILRFEVNNPDFFIQYDNFQFPEKSSEVKMLDMKNVPQLNDKAEKFIARYAKDNTWNKLKSWLNTFN